MRRWLLLVIVCTVLAGAQPVGFHQVLSLHVTPEQAAASPILEVSIQVPDGLRRLDVAYALNDRVSSDAKPGEGNVVDIGIMDP
ncbi:MAG: hypothetical protein ACYCW6_18175, partial [Candidatus Xenobia bacterium]